MITSVNALLQVDTATTTAGGVLAGVAVMGLLYGGYRLLTDNNKEKEGKEENPRERRIRQ